MPLILEEMRTKDLESQSDLHQRSAKRKPQTKPQSIKGEVLGGGGGAGFSIAENLVGGTKS